MWCLRRFLLRGVYDDFYLRGINECYVCFKNKQMWELWFRMEIKMGFGIYEVENKEYGVSGLGSRILEI